MRSAPMGPNRGPRGMAGQEFRIGLPREGALRMTCQEARCEQEANGWATVLDPRQPKHAAAAQWLREQQSRHFFELRSEEALEWLDAKGAGAGVEDRRGALRALLGRTPPGMLVFVFPPGQVCFRPHLDREVVFQHRQGAHTRVHERPEDYIEHWNEESYRVNRMMGKG